MKLKIPIDQRLDKPGYQRVAAQARNILAQLAANGVATIKLRYPSDADSLAISAIGKDNFVMLRADGRTLYVTPKPTTEAE